MSRQIVRTIRAALIAAPLAIPSVAFSQTAAGGASSGDRRGHRDDFARRERETFRAAAASDGSARTKASGAPARGSSSDSTGSDVSGTARTTGPSGIDSYRNGIDDHAAQGARSGARRGAPAGVDVAPASGAPGTASGAPAGSTGPSTRTTGPDDIQH